MKDINNVVLIGRLTKDAESHTFDNGSSVLSFSIAVNTSKKENDNWVDVPNFFNVKYYAKKIDKLMEMLKKGSQLCVDGYLVQEHWEKDGKKNSQVVVMAESLQMCGNKKADGNSNGSDAGFQEDYPF